jgi:hypothetical protein
MNSLIPNLEWRTALQVAPFRPDLQRTTFYHLDCAVSDGSFLRADEVTEEDRSHGVYWMER